jgi:hypothetical protein
MKIQQHDKTRCFYCDELMLKPTKEHIVPKSKFGINAKRNIVLVCKKCNLLRGNHDLVHFYSLCNDLKIKIQILKLIRYVEVEYHNLIQPKNQRKIKNNLQ